MEREQEAASAAAAAAAAAFGSTGGVCGSPAAGGSAKRDRSPTKETPSAGRGNPSPKPDLSGLAKMQLSTE